MTPWAAPVSAELVGDRADTSAWSPAVDENNDCSKANSPSELSAENCGIIKYIIVITNVLAALVGVVVLFSVVMGGIQYSTAGANPKIVAMARKRIINALLALAVFVFMYAFLQWLVPGGLFYDGN